MNPRHKNIVLVIGLLLLWIVAYQFSFSKTFVIRSEVTQLEAQQQAYASAPTQLAALTHKEQQLDTILQTHHMAGSSVQQNVLQALNALSVEKGFTIVAFEKPHVYTEEETQKTTTTYDMTLQGDYLSLLQVVYALEQHYSFGNVIQLDLQKKKNFRTRTSQLQCRILLQRLQ